MVVPKTTASQEKQQGKKKNNVRESTCGAKNNCFFMRSLHWDITET